MTTQDLCDRANELNKALGHPGTYTAKGRRKAGMKAVVELLERELEAK